MPMDPNKKRVLLAGCGRAGILHLQGIAGLPEIQSLEVYDPWSEALKQGRERLDGMADKAFREVRWMSSLADAVPGGDLCVIATQADLRCAVIYDVDRRLGYKSFLLETSVAQSMPDYDALLDLAKSRNLSIWVYCPARAASVHRHIKTRLDPSSPLTVTAQGGNLGLASRGLHSADLFAFHEGADVIDLVHADVEPRLQPTDRGADVFDLIGTLVGGTKRGSRLVLSYADHQAEESVTITSTGYRAIVDDARGLYLESTRESGWAWTPISCEPSTSVISATRGFVSGILRERRCNLPTLRECYASHKFIFSSLQPHFEKLTGVRGRSPIA